MNETGLLEYVILAVVLLLCLLYVCRSIWRMFGKKGVTPGCGCACGQTCSPPTPSRIQERPASLRRSEKAPEKPEETDQS
jgi:hypothetical protein